MTYKQKIKRLVAGMLFACVLFVSYSAFSVWQYSVKNDLKEADVAIVLGAANWDTKPSPVLKERLNHAVWLYKEGYVDHLIFTGGKYVPDAMAESEVSKQYAIDQGVAAEDISIEIESTNTEENLEYAAAILREKGWKKATLVSDPFHMKRSILIANHLGMDVYASPTQTSAFRTKETKVPFFLKEWMYSMGYTVTAPFRNT